MTNTYTDFLKHEMSKEMLNEVAFLMKADFSDDELDKLGYSDSIVAAAHEEIDRPRVTSHRKAYAFYD